ncbi:hypothetical protein DPMN_163906 [Dreissena polymorpha]|uniref:Uncharacterized protein n=1 Tax=Dreissena polymorpha TaxID=45954 RepID=A0A9D4IV20_DREPO|nr:hypothetical protein DPMN_163906 [Dreissena polymorpha]
MKNKSTESRYTTYNDTGDTLRCNIRNSKLYLGPNGIIMTSQAAKNCIVTSAYDFGPYTGCGCLAGHYSAIVTSVGFTIS